MEKSDWDQLKRKSKSGPSSTHRGANPRVYDKTLLEFKHHILELPLSWLNNEDFPFENYSLILKGDSWSTIFSNDLGFDYK